MNLYNIQSYFSTLKQGQFNVYKVNLNFVVLEIGIIHSKGTMQCLLFGISVLLMEIKRTKMPAGKVKDEKYAKKFGGNSKIPYSFQKKTAKARRFSKI